MGAQPRAPLPRADELEERELVINAAGQLLSSSGLDALTLNAVAARVHLPEQLIYRWWPSEEALALDVLRREWIARAASVRRAALRCGL